MFKFLAWYSEHALHRVNRPSLFIGTLLLNSVLMLVHMACKVAFETNVVVYLLLLVDVVMIPVLVVILVVVPAYMHATQVLKQYRKYQAHNNK